MTGPLTPEREAEIRAFFLSRIEKSTDGCWFWTGPIDKDGYGRFARGPMRLHAHRASYELLVGPIPDGLTIDHMCHDGSLCNGGVHCLHRRCVNPAHLEPATMRDNSMRGNGVSAINARKTHCDFGHAYDDTNTYWRSNGHRGCRKCIVRRSRMRGACSVCGRRGMLRVDGTVQAHRLCAGSGKLPASEAVAA